MFNKNNDTNSYGVSLQYNLQFEFNTALFI